jgi:hypothetical protein
VHRCVEVVRALVRAERLDVLDIDVFPAVGKRRQGATVTLQGDRLFAGRWA